VFRQHRPFVLLTVALILAGCEGSRNNSSWSTRQENQPIVPPLTVAATPTQQPATTTTTTITPTTPVSGSVPTGSGRGVGPVDNVDISKLDAARALKGSQLFPVKCSACHKIEERYIGPALSGVTKRRRPEWILNMILNPENMIQQDPTAKALITIYIAPMANQHLTREEAESILAFFLQHDASLKESPDVQATPGTQPAQPASQH